jgi:hypothetical protein
MRGLFLALGLLLAFATPALADYDIGRGVECPDGGTDAVVAALPLGTTGTATVTLLPEGKVVWVPLFTKEIASVAQAAMFTGARIKVGFGQGGVPWVKVLWGPEPVCWADVGVMPDPDRGDKSALSRPPLPGK